MMRAAIKNITSSGREARFVDRAQMDVDSLDAKLAKLYEKRRAHTSLEETQDDASSKVMALLGHQIMSSWDSERACPWEMLSQTAAVCTLMCFGVREGRERRIC